MVGKVGHTATACRCVSPPFSSSLLCGTSFSGVEGDVTCFLLLVFSCGFVSGMGCRRKISTCKSGNCAACSARRAWKFCSACRSAPTVKNHHLVDTHTPSCEWCGAEKGTALHTPHDAYENVGEEEEIGSGSFLEFCAEEEEEDRPVCGAPVMG